MAACILARGQPRSRSEMPDHGNEADLRVVGTLVFGPNSEARILETRKKTEPQTPNPIYGRRTEMCRKRTRRVTLFRPSVFGLLSDLGFRTSDLVAVIIISVGEDELGTTTTKRRRAAETAFNTLGAWILVLLEEAMPAKDQCSHARPLAPDWKPGLPPALAAAVVRRRHHLVLRSDSEISTLHCSASASGAVTLPTELVQKEVADKRCPLVSTQREVTREEKL